MQRFSSALIISSALVFSSAEAANITASTSKEGKDVIVLSGEIAPGDADRVKSLTKAANDAGRLVSGIRLDSAGGNLAEGLKLADLIKFGKVATVVPAGSRCASACFIVFAAGLERYASHSAWVGVHGASDRDGRESVRSGAATVTMARAVKELGVPAEIIGKMVVTPPDQILWLSPDDLRSMDVTMTGKPAQVPPTAETRAGPPAQVPPSPTARAASNTPPTWEAFSQQAIELSQHQNGGKASLNRVCQPELKTCSIAVFFKTVAGKDGMLKVTENLVGRVIQREFCEFNDFRDVRTCVDWDTEKSRRDMKDGSGNWYKVSDE